MFGDTFVVEMVTDNDKVDDDDDDGGADDANEMRPQSPKKSARIINIKFKFKFKFKSTSNPISMPVDISTPVRHTLRNYRFVVCIITIHREKRTTMFLFAIICVDAPHQQIYILRSLASFLTFSHSHAFVRSLVLKFVVFLPHFTLSIHTHFNSMAQICYVFIDAAAALSVIKCSLAIVCVRRSMEHFT